MKKNIFIIAGILLLSSMLLLITACGNGFSGEWVAKINGETITDEELDNYYYAQHKSMMNLSKEEIDKLAANPSATAQNPLLNKQEFLEQMIRQQLVYQEAVDAGALKDDEVKALIDMTKQSVVMGWYVKDKFKDDIEISQDEIEQVYARQRSRFQGVPIEQAEMYIKQNIYQQKMQMKLREMVENLREESKIEKNTELLRKKIKDSNKEVEQDAATPPLGKQPQQ